jgi:glycosidase
MTKRDMLRGMKEKLVFLYGEKTGQETHNRLKQLLERYTDTIPSIEFSFSQEDVVLITYGDGFLKKNSPPLAALREFLVHLVQDSISIVHILPFFPYSSDDGFSVVDYKQVNPDLGSWEDIDGLKNNYNLMFDAVINHISARSREFREFLSGNKKYKNFFIIVGPDYDVSNVFRPRALPLLTQFNTSWGELSIWTTFSTDQIDLNYTNPTVLLHIIDVLLFYVAHGASLIRLDAIAFLWKESGTECLHLPQTHTVIKLFRQIFDYIAPHVKIITETNVPHRDNISYFGKGNDEAHMVYNFALPPLTAHALVTGNGSYLTKWASTLSLPGTEAWFYNFTASHDGIGLLPARGILPEHELDVLIRTTENHRGKLGLKNNPDGSTSVYELNISLFDLLSDPGSDEPASVKVSRLIASQAIALSLRGIPAVYYHTLVGSQNYYEGVEKTGMNRSINREKLHLEQLEDELARPGSIRAQVFTRLKQLIDIRKTCSAFHPGGEQNVLDLDRGVFAVERISPDGNESVLALINVTGLNLTLTTVKEYRDVITGRKFTGDIELHPYEVLWLSQ